MITVYDFGSRTLVNTTLSTPGQGRTRAVTNAGDVRLRVNITSLSAGGSLRVTGAFTFPNGAVQQIDRTFDTLGANEIGLWNGHVRTGDVLVSATIQATGTVQFTASIISFAQGEGVPEWQ